MAPTTCRRLFVVVLTLAGCRGNGLPISGDAAVEPPAQPDGAAATVKLDAPVPPPVPPDAAPACSITLALESAPPNPPSPPQDPLPPQPLPRMGLKPGKPTLLTPQQLAGRLTHFLWNAEPDPELVARIAACPPGSPDAVRQLARLMLKDPRAHQGIEAFFRWWLTLDRLDDLGLANPTLGADLVDAIVHEPGRLGAHVILEGDGRYPTLLTANFTFVNEPLARHYGIPGVTGNGVTKVMLDGKTRLGLLTQAALLLQGASPEETSPTRRGYFLRERLLCEPTPPEPPGINVPARPSGVTAREWLDSTIGPVCRPCHELMDPMGLSFEVYDHLARHRDTDQGKPIDTAGRVKSFGPTDDLAFTDSLDLARKLAQNRLGEGCFVQKWVEYAAGPNIKSEDLKAAEGLADQFLASGSNIPWLIVEVTGTELFLNR